MLVSNNEGPGVFVWKKYISIIGSVKYISILVAVSFLTFYKCFKIMSKIVV